MRIKIARKLQLFSNEAGSTLMVLNTDFKVTIYPTLLLFKSLAGKKEFEIKLDIIGPVEGFTIFYDLQKAAIGVRGFSKKGFFAYRILEDDKQIKIKFIRGKKRKDIILPIKDIVENKPKEELSFGIHKKQDLELINRREDLKEICPILFKLGQYIEILKKVNVGTAKLLNEIEKSIKAKKINELEKQFKIFYQAAFSKYFIPRLDDQHQGIIKESKTSAQDVLYILYQASKLIRSFFIYEEKKSLHILPALMPSFHCGRMLNLDTSFGKIDIEWSKKLIRRMILRSSATAKFKLQLQSKIKSFRLKTSKRDKGIVVKRDSLIEIKPNQTYFFDNFKK